MSAQTENAASMAPEKVEKMKATAVNTESVDHNEVSKPIFSKLISVNDDAASMTANPKTPAGVEFKAMANDEMEAESDAVSSHLLLGITRSQHSYKMFSPCKIEHFTPILP